MEQRSEVGSQRSEDIRLRPTGYAATRRAEVRDQKTEIRGHCVDCGFGIADCGFLKRSNRQLVSAFSLLFLLLSIADSAFAYLETDFL